MQTLHDEGPYVYQPFGIKEKTNWNCVPKRIFGVGGLHILADIKGLTKDEAEVVCKALKQYKAQMKIVESSQKPCGPGCIGHITHPCEKCGQQWGEHK